MTESRRIRAFVSSTFRDMVAERDELMTHAWPELRRFCRERQVELVEVDLRWGIAEEQSTRKETLKLCLDEIRSCRPFFIGLLGERYGWTPGDDTFTADLTEEQPWLKDLARKSVTELEILHGVLNSPEMASRAFFYFRDPAYAKSRGLYFLAEDPASEAKQAALKGLIRQTCASKHIPLCENYPDPRALAGLVLADLKAAITAQFPTEEIPDPLTRTARDHKAFAEIRRRTYIGRPDYFAKLDQHAGNGGGPLVLLGDSAGKSALLANWVEHWRGQHPGDFIFEHYIGGTPDSADHWRLMTRLISEIKRWSADPEEVPRNHDDLLKDLPIWLAKARSKAEHDGIRFLVVLDALNQLEDRDHARLLGWLPSHPFTGPLRLVVSTLPVKQGDDPLQVVTEWRWESLRVEPLTPDERRQMIDHYLKRFGKKLDRPRVKLLSLVAAAGNPLYLKILLDELRVTGTHERLDERLNNYLAAPDIPALLRQVLARYQKDYERDRPGLVSEALGLIWAARRGLTETELLRLLKPANLPQLPLVTWSPLRAALEEGLVDRGGILNFAHDFLRTSVETAFVPDSNRNQLRLQLADDFEKQPVTARSCDELPWLLWQAKQNGRLRECLLDLDRFLEIQKRDQEELTRYWVDLGEERTMGGPYLAAFEQWGQRHDEAQISHAANELFLFLNDAGLNTEAEPLIRRALAIDEKLLRPDHPNFAAKLNNLASLLTTTKRLAEAEPVMRRALAIAETTFDPRHPRVGSRLNNLAQLLLATKQFAEAETLLHRALVIHRQSSGPEHREVARDLNEMARLLENTNRPVEAEQLYRRALEIQERHFGIGHPDTAVCISNLARLLQTSNELEESELLYRRALTIDEKSFGPEHPGVAIVLNNLATLLQKTNRLAEAESLLRRALAIDEQSFGPEHPGVAGPLGNLGKLLMVANRLAEAEPLLRRVLAIDERSFGPDDPNVAIRLNNLAASLYGTNRLAEAEPLLRRALAIDEKSFGPDDPNVSIDVNNLALLLRATDRLAEAEFLLRRALGTDERAHGVTNPKIPHRINNLCTVLIMEGKLGEAKPLLARAWHLKSGQHDLTSTRLLFVRLIVALLESQPIGTFAGQMKTLFLAESVPDHAHVEKVWNIPDFTKFVRPKLRERNAEFITAIVSAMNDRANLFDLDRFPQWRDQTPVTLDIAWPND